MSKGLHRLEKNLLAGFGYSGYSAYPVNQFTKTGDVFVSQNFKHQNVLTCACVITYVEYIAVACG